MENAIPLLCFRAGMEKFRRFGLWACVALGATSCATSSSGEPAAPPYIIAYLFGRAPFDGDKIDVERLTHINYAFADAKPDGEVLSFLPHDSANFATLNALKRRNPSLKLLISIGGWTHSKGFSDAALSAASRARFAESAVAFMRRHGLDGVDIDWEYPGQIGDNNPFRPEDKQHFTLLLAALREKLDEASAADGRGQQPYLLTIATGANQTYLDHTEMDKAQHHLDFINIMTYDFAGGWVDTTAHHANLFASPVGRGSRIDAHDAVRRHIDAGVPAEKLVLGVPFYGRGWSGVRPIDHGLHQPASGTTYSYPYHTLVDSLIDRNGFKRYWDEAARAPFLWSDSAHTFFTYESPESIAHKTAFIKEMGLRGAMFWEYHADTAGALLRALHAGLSGAEPQR
jgi:chitinase